MASLDTLAAVARVPITVSVTLPVNIKCFVKSLTVSAHCLSLPCPTLPALLATSVVLAMQEQECDSVHDDEGAGTTGRRELRMFW